MIPPLVDEADIEAYAQAAMAYKSTLECLLFCSTFRCEEATDFYMTQYRTIMEHLNEFPQLKRLQVTSYTNKSIFDLESYMNQCCLLQDIKFNPIRLEDVLLQQRQQQSMSRYSRKARRDQDEITNLSTINQLTSVKHFSGDRMMMTDWSLCYLMHKFPKLKTLFLNSMPDEESETMLLQTFEISDSTMYAFSQYLSRMSNYQIRGRFLGKDPTDVMGIFIEATRPKKYKIDITYTISSEEEEGYYPLMKLYACFNSAVMSLSSATMVSNEYCNKLDAQYLLDTVNFTSWPHMPIIAKFGSGLRELVFGAGSGVFLDRTEVADRAYNDGIYRCLDQILHKCTSLEHFILEDIDLSNRQLEATNTSITTLEIFLGTILWGGLEEISKQLPSLKRLILNETDIQIPLFAQEFCAMNIGMSTSDLDNITWKKISCEFDETDVQKFFLHVRKDATTTAGDNNDNSVDKFYALWRIGQVEEITKDDFYFYSSQDDQYLCLDVYCKSLKSFTIQYMTEMDQTYILD